LRKEFSLEHASDADLLTSRYSFVFTEVTVLAVYNQIEMDPFLAIALEQLDS